MLIREAYKNEAETIAGYQVKMAKETEGLILDKQTVLSGIHAVFDDPTKGRYYVAVENNSIIGSLLTTYEWSDWRNAFVIWIQSVYVCRVHRGKGIFKTMYRYLKSSLLSRKSYCGIRLYVDKRNRIAQKVYDKIGMNGNHYILYEDMRED